VPGTALYGLWKKVLAKMTFESVDNGTNWNCLIQICCNFHAGKEDAVLRHWSEFNSKLLQRIKQTFPDDPLNLKTEKDPEEVIEAKKPEIKAPAPMITKKAKRQEIINE
jgi:hypothetical protein